jgi:ATP-dependent DNA helicase RecG
MPPFRSDAYLVGLVREFCKLPAETGWIEFKVNNTDAQEIGEYISALSNAAALAGKGYGYLLWGIDDVTHAIVGTDFRPEASKKGNEDLESWLLRLLSPKLHFSFSHITIDDKDLVLLEIPAASGKPTSFANIEYTRVGSYKKSLKDFPEHERSLWRIFDRTPFEELVAEGNLSSAEILELIDYPAYFSLLNVPLPREEQGILDSLAQDRMIRIDDAGSWEVTNLGAVLFARDLHSFKGLSRKALRLIVWEGKGRFKTVREQLGQRGYANGFERLIDFLTALLPRNEVIGKALRREVPMYPDLAVRELIANALIHQDFSITGAGPMVEVFSDRMEITNPGGTLVNVDRLLDSPPRSRNEVLASFMRRVGICEERGSGVDKVVLQSEIYQLPAPVWELPDDSVRVILFAHKEFAKMDKSSRVHACYLHACLRHVMREPMTNTSLRERFGIEPHNSAIASRIIRDAQDADLIKPYGDLRGKHVSYVPFWA